MLIVVCVKQVPDTSEVKVDPETGTLIRDGVPSVMNPFDQYALEVGVRIRAAAGDGAELVVLSMGPSQARSVLMKALALGADRAILLTDIAFAGADTWATSYTLAVAMKTIGDPDLILCGLQAIDGDTAQTGPEIAQHLHFPQVTYADTVTLDGKKLIVNRQTDTGSEVVEVRLPALVSCTPPPDFVPSTPPFSAIMKAKKKPYEEWGVDKINVDMERIGLKGSPTQVRRVFSPPKRDQGVMFEGSAAEVAGSLCGVLVKEGGL